MDSNLSPLRKNDSSDNSGNLMISLYLVLLVFFIAMCYFANVDARRAALVSSGVSDRFAGTRSSHDSSLGADELLSLSSLSPAFLKIYHLFRQLSKYVILVDDRLTVSVDLKILYQNFAANTKPDLDNIFRDIAAIISTQDHFAKLIYYAHSDIGISSDIERVENFAKKMMSFGINQDNIVVSVSDQGPKCVMISFVILDKGLWISS